MLEYEDTFPFSDELESVRSSQAYSEQDIVQILLWAQESNLEVTPLVQTFGHLEWILKHEKFAQYREVPQYSQTICLSNDDAINLVKKAIDQVMRFHSETSDYFHIGADEAYQVLDSFLDYS